MPLLYSAAAGIVLRSSVAELWNRAALIGGLAEDTMYMHCAFSRADLEHLLGSMPVLLVTLAAISLELGGARFKQSHRLLQVVFAVLTLFVLA